MATQSSSTYVDLESIRSKLSKLNASNKRQNAIWKPPVGESVVRIVPYKHAKDPFNDLLFHYDVGNKTALCASNFAKQCPICDYAQELRKDKSEDGYKAFKKIAAKSRVYIPVLVRGKENEGVKFWGVGKEVYETLLGFFINPEYGDITHPTEGVDITVNFTGKTPQLVFGKTTVVPKRNSTPLHESRDMIVKLIKEVPNVFEIFPEQSFEELKKVLNDALNPTVEENVSKTEDIGEVIEASSTSKPITDLDKEFEDILNSKKKN